MGIYIGLWAHEDLSLQVDRYVPSGLICMNRDVSVELGRLHRYIRLDASPTPDVALSNVVALVQRDHMV